MRQRSVAGRIASTALGVIVSCMAWGAGSAEDGLASSGYIETLEVEGHYPGIAGARERADAIPGAVRVVDIADLQQRSAASLADLLRYVPGLWAESDAGGEGVFFSSRGSNLDATDYDQNGVELLQDGLPVTTADGNNHNRVIDPLTAQYASVARGANAMEYGASTLGGAIDFATPTGRDRGPLELRVDGGSHGLLAGRATMAGAMGAVDGLITVESRDWDGYRAHNEQRRRGVYGNAGLTLGDDLTTRFYATWLDNDQELTGAMSRAEMVDDPDQAGAGAIGGNFQLDVDTWRIANKTRWTATPTQRAEFGVSLEKQSLFHPIVDKVLVDSDGPGPAAPVEVFSLLIDTDHRDIGAMGRLYQTLGRHELTFGVNYGDDSVDGGHYRNDGGHRNGLMETIDNKADTSEVFALDRWRLTDRLTLTLAAQGVWANRSVRSTNAASGAVTATHGDYSTVNPRAGVIYRWSDVASLYANVSRLYEPPTNFELQDDVDPGGAPLDAMHGTVVEVGARGAVERGQGRRWYWDAALYYAWIGDEILSVDDPAVPGTSLVTNVDDTVHAGIEAVLGGDWSLTPSGAHTLETVLNVTINDFRFDGDAVYGDNDLPAAPAYVVRGELIYRLASGFFGGPTFDLVGDRYADFANRYEVDDYGLLGLRGGWQNASVQVFVEVRNLLDEDYVSTLSVRNSAAPDAQILNPGMPRSLYAGLVVAF